MLRKGTLKTWKDDRGFGFIAPDDGGEELFVHISAFPRDGSRPSIGESVLFETGYDREGRPRATRIHHGVYRGESPPPRRQARSGRGPRAMHTRKVASPVPLILVLLGIGGFFVLSDLEVMDKAKNFLSGFTSSPEAYEKPTDPRFHCDGRTHCSEMSSCSEATFFLENCPGTKMDGDGDGIPCERQWCG